MNHDWRGRPAVLCIAHPGHELRVHGWLGLARPEVCVLTDGSGRSGVSRLDFTRQVLRESGARPGRFFGALSDAEAYAAVLEGRAAPFLAAIGELSAMLTAHDGGYVVGDAAEGYNAVHDLCRVVINAAVARARAAGVRIDNYEFPLVGSPAAGADERRDGAIEVRLSSAQLERKLAVAKSSPELAPDVDEALRAVGPQAFAVELLRLSPSVPGDGLGDAAPYYERRGDEQVRAGKYARVLRRREHVLPLAAALWRGGRAAE